MKAAVRTLVFVFLCASFVVSASLAQIPTPTPNPDAWRVDLDGDGQIDTQDFFLFREFWHTQNITTPTPTGTPTSTFTVTPTPTQEEIPPYVASTPPRFALVGELLLYQVVAVDPNGDSITFAPVTVPAGMTVSATGLVTWTPTQAGMVVVSIGLADGKNPQVLHEFTLHVGVVETEVSGVVTTTEGGTVEVNDPNSPIDGTRIEVPPGGLTEDATVTIRSVSNPDAFFVGAIPVTIDGLPANATLTLEIPVDPSLLSIYGGGEQDLVVLYLDPSTGEWIEAPAQQVKRNKLGDPIFLTTTIDMRTAGSTVAVITTRTVSILNHQPNQIELVKPQGGSPTGFYTANSSPGKKRLIVIHGLGSNPETFMKPNDFLNPSNPIGASLYSLYDYVAVYRYPSGLPVSQNAQIFVDLLRHGYSSIPANSAFSMGSNPSFKFDLLCHSMGGLVARHALEKASLSANLGKLITLGSPHGGAVTRNQVWGAVFTTAFNDGVFFGFPGMTDLVVGSPFLSVLNNSNASPNTYKPAGSQRYYCIAGLKANSIPANSDGWVTEESARFLNLPLTREKTFGPDGDRFEHSNLHELAATNGVGQQVLDWLLTTPAPTRTPTATPIPHTGERVVVDLPDWPYPDPPEGPRKLEFVRIPAGSFMMGSENERGGQPNESPRHEVFIDYDFYMGVTEVTQLQWRAIWGSVPFVCGKIADDYPVCAVSWMQIQTYLTWLNGLGIGEFRLPSESEWEYACRAGTTSPPYRFSFGPNLFCDDSCGSCPLADQYMWWCGNAASEGNEVAQKFANPWGLFDMHGNLWEWVQDEWHESYSGAPEDGSAWNDNTSSDSVVRGGSWGDYASSCRSASRYHIGRSTQGRGIVGFRLCMTAD